jgi:CRISPR-associated protein Cas1
MAWRGVHLSEPCRLSLAQGALKVERVECDPVTAPLEDLGWIIVDTPQATLTSRLLSACAEADVAVLFIDERHHPVATLIPKAGYHRQLDTLRLQLSAKEGLKGRLWKRIVQRKIENQAAVLAACGGGKAATISAALLAMANRIRASDPLNVEAQAAQAYWPVLFPNFARRDGGDGRNAFLNYGYAVVRAIIARELAALGFEPSLGLHHVNALNPFNLADDLMEAFRPLVDRHVHGVLHDNAAVANPEIDLGKEEKQALAALPGVAVLIDEESMALLNSVGRSVSTLRAALKDRQPRTLQLPELGPG